MSCIVFSRYVLDSQPVERFVQFIGMKDQSAAELFNTAFAHFKKNIRLS